MRTFTIMAGTCAALIALPASAQLAGTVGGTVNTGVNAGVNTAQTTGTVLNTAGTVTNRVEAASGHVANASQRATDRAMAAANLTLVTRQQVQTGLVVRDLRGQRIGTVSSLDARTAIVVSGNRKYRVPLTALYRRTTATATAAANGLVSSIPRARLTAQVNARASPNSAASAGN